MAAPLKAGRAFFRTVNIEIFTKRFLIRPPASLGGKPFKKKRDGPSVLDEEMSLDERLTEMRLNTEDPDLTRPINIGKPVPVSKKLRKHKLSAAVANKKDASLEKAAREKMLQIPLDEVTEEWFKEYGPSQIHTIASHYGIYRDLFNDAFFRPSLDLGVFYEYDDEFVTPVFRGNKIKASEASQEPYVVFSGSADKLYTLVLTNPDGHLTDNSAEYLHWMVGNIPGDDLSKGEVLCDYLPPFPPQGTGFHRHVFLLYEHDTKLDLGKHKRPSGQSLQDRTFVNLEFYREHQDNMTPVGLAFYQSEWDHSVRDVYHNMLNMKEPSFEFKHPVQYIAKQKKYPHKEPFDRYYDRYRDRKDIAEEVMKQKLSMISPYKQYEPEWKYPIVHLRSNRKDNYKPTWLKKREELMHRRQEQYKDLP